MKFVLLQEEMSTIYAPVAKYRTTETVKHVVVHSSNFDAVGWASGMASGL